MGETFEHRIPIEDLGFESRWSGEYDKVFSLSKGKSLIPSLDTYPHIVELDVGVRTKRDVIDHTFQPDGIGTLDRTLFTPGGELVSARGYNKRMVVLPSGAVFEMDTTHQGYGLRDFWGELMPTAIDSLGYLKPQEILAMSSIPTSNFKAVMQPGKLWSWDHKKRSLTEGERKELSHFMQGATEKYSLEHLVARRKLFFDIVGGEIPVVPPDIVSEGYYDVLPVRVMTGCEGLCKMCDFYGKRTANILPTSQVFEQIDNLNYFMGSDYVGIRRFFLTDGDALMVDSGELEKIIGRINTVFDLNFEPEKGEPEFGEPYNFGFAYVFSKARTVAGMEDSELRRLRQAGLGYVNIGQETAHEKLLRMVKPDLDLRDVKTAALKLDRAGIRCSVNIIPELGGEQWLERNREAAGAFFGSEDLEPVFTRYGHKGIIYLAPIQRNPAYMKFLARNRLTDNSSDGIKPQEGYESREQLDLFNSYYRTLADRNVACSRYTFVGM